MQVEQNPFLAPEEDTAPPPQRTRPDPAGYRFAGFWIRFVAVFLDGIILSVPGFIIGLAIGAAFGNGQAVEILGTLLDNGIDLVYTVWMWVAFGATLGKMAVGIRVIDARTGAKPSLGQAIGRWFAYILSALILLIGYIMAAFDERKRALHDRLCNTYVVYDSGRGGSYGSTRRRTRSRPALDQD